MTSKRTFGRTLMRLLTIYLPVLIVLVLILFPFYWMIVTSFKADSELTVIASSRSSGSCRRIGVSKPPIAAGVTDERRRDCTDLRGD